MSQDSCPTLEIQTDATAQNPSGIVVINECDFDAETMTLANQSVEETVPQNEETVPPVATPVVTATVASIEPPTAPPAPTGKAAKAVAPWAAK